MATYTWRYACLLVFVLICLLMLPVKAPVPPPSFARFLYMCRETVNDVCRLLSSDEHGEDYLDSADGRLARISVNLGRAAHTYPGCTALQQTLQSMRNDIEDLRRTHSSRGGYGFSIQRLSDGRVGPPTYQISREQLEFFLDLEFSVAQMARMLHVSLSTVHRRLRHFALRSRQRYSAISDAELDSLIEPICHRNNCLGYRGLLGGLSSMGYRIQRSRVLSSMLRVDPTSVALRWCRSVQRRTYRVAGPNSLWHIDGNHKLIRWGFVIHGGIDGFSRLIVFMSASNNNRAATVFTSFMTATGNYGVPSRVRADHGSENNDVENFITVYHGPSRGSMIRGLSVHNQRIERLWVDVYHGCTYLYYDLFYFLEDQGILDVNNAIHLWCLHYIFIPRIQHDLDVFRQQWNRHRLSTENGRTPLQMYVEGALRLYGTDATQATDLFFDPGQSEDLQDFELENYGVDWNWPIPPLNNNNTVVLESNDCPLSDRAYRNMCQTVNPLSNSADGYGIDHFLMTLEYVNRELDS